MPSVLNRGKVSRVRIAHAVCEETLQYILDWEFIFSVCVTLLLFLLLTYAKKEKDLMFYLTLLLINVLAVLWVYWRCISRPSMQYIELSSNPQVHLSSDLVHGGGDRNRNSGRYSCSLHTIQDILDTNALQEATPAFWKGQLRQSVLRVYGSDDSFGDDDATVVAAAATAQGEEEHDGEKRRRSGIRA